MEKNNMKKDIKVIFDRLRDEYKYNGDELYTGTPDFDKAEEECYNLLKSQIIMTVENILQDLRKELAKSRAVSSSSAYFDGHYSAIVLAMSIVRKRLREVL